MGMYTTILFCYGYSAGHPQVAGNFRAADPRCGCAVEGALFFRDCGTGGVVIYGDLIVIQW